MTDFRAKGLAKAEVEADKVAGLPALWAWLLVGSAWTYPVAVAVSMAGSWMSYRMKSYKAATLWSLLPLLNIGLILGVFAAG